MSAAPSAHATILDFFMNMLLFLAFRCRSSFRLHRGTLADCVYPRARWCLSIIAHSEPAVATARIEFAGILARTVRLLPAQNAAVTGERGLEPRYEFRKGLLGVSH
jgi:hypothetical protein